MSKEAMKLALEALEDENSLSKMKTARDILREALAKQEQGEPVAWCWRSVSTGELFDFTERLHPEDLESDNLVPLYTTPQQRKPLTDEQINELRQQYGVTSNGRGIKEFTKVRDFARAIEAAHGIKE